MKRLLVFALLLLFVCPVCFARDFSLEDMNLVPMSGIKASVSQGYDTASGQPAMMIKFSKQGAERRFVALQSNITQDLGEVKSLRVRCRVDMVSGIAPRLALLAWTKTGESWYKVGGNPMMTGTMDDFALPLGSMVRTTFSVKSSEDFDWSTVTRVWLGAVVDGAAEGTITAQSAVLSTDVYVPTVPVSVTTATEPGTWGAGQDPAVQSEITYPNDGPDGQACMRYDFTVPGGAHMYALPSTAVPVSDLEGYATLRFLFRHSIPQGMRLLVTLSERTGGQYCVEMEPPLPGEWQEMLLPLSTFQEAGWSKDTQNGKFDVGNIGSVIIGTHGAAVQAGPGSIEVAEVQFMP